VTLGWHFGGMSRGGKCPREFCEGNFWGKCPGMLGGIFWGGEDFSQGECLGGIVQVGV